MLRGVVDMRKWWCDLLVFCSLLPKWLWVRREVEMAIGSWSFPQRGRQQAAPAAGGGGAFFTQECMSLSRDRDQGDKALTPVPTTFHG